jgi:hypothetical protein
MFWVPTRTRPGSDPSTPSSWPPRAMRTVRCSRIVGVTGCHLGGSTAAVSRRVDDLPRTPSIVPQRPGNRSVFSVQGSARNHRSSAKQTATVRSEGETTTKPVTTRFARETIGGPSERAPLPAGRAPSREACRSPGVVPLRILGGGSFAINRRIGQRGTAHPAYEPKQFYIPARFSTNNSAGDGERATRTRGGRSSTPQETAQGFEAPSAWETTLTCPPVTTSVANKRRLSRKVLNRCRNERR